MSKQSFTTGQVLTAAQVNSLQANDYNQTVSVKTASYVLVAADKGTRIEFNTSGSVTCTVNSGLFDAGDTLVIQNRGAGTATVTAGTATVNTSASLVVKQYDSGVLYFVSDSSAIYFASDAADTPLTTKGDLFTFSTAADRIAVGSNGETLVADSSTTTGLRYQSGVNTNSIINGGMDIWQRGTSFTAASVYTADRWFKGSQANWTTSRQASGLTGFTYSMRLQRDSGNAVTTGCLMLYTLETADSLRFADKTVTVSYYAKAGANYSPTSSAFIQQLYTGTGTDQRRDQSTGFTGETTVVNSSVTLTTSWQRFSFTANIGSSSTEIAVAFGFTPTGTAGANDFAEFTGVQIELGSVATAFKRVGGNIAGELAACQRYYYKHAATGANSGITPGGFYSATTLIGIVTFPITMRTSPTFSAVTGTNYYQSVRNGGVNNLNSLSQDTANANASQIFNNTEASGTAGHYANIIANNASASIAWSAEL